MARRLSEISLITCGLAVAASLAIAQSKGEKAAPAKKTDAPAATSAKGDIKKGKESYETYCEICHYAASSEKKIGPGLKGIYKRGKFADGKKVDDQTMRRWIESGGKDMPAFNDQLTAAQITDLIAYLRTL